jgi:hypothetical protein
MRVYRDEHQAFGMPVGMSPLQAAKPEEVFFPLLKPMLVQSLMTGEATECGMEVI